MGQRISKKKLIKLSKEAFKDGSYRVGTRIHAVILNMEGLTAPEIAAILKVHRTNVSAWLLYYEQFGIEGLLEGQRSGRPKGIAEKELITLSEIIDSGPIAYGFISAVWTSPMIVKVIENEFSITYSSSHVTRILHSLDFSVQRPKKKLIRADEKSQHKWTRYKYPNIKKKPKMKKP